MITTLFQILKNWPTISFKNLSNLSSVNGQAITRKLCQYAKRHLTTLNRICSLMCSKFPAHTIALSPRPANLTCTYLYAYHMQVYTYLIQVHTYLTQVYTYLTQVHTYLTQVQTYLTQVHAYLAQVHTYHLVYLSLISNEIRKFSVQIFTKISKNHERTFENCEISSGF